VRDIADIRHTLNRNPTGKHNEGMRAPNDESNLYLFPRSSVAELDFEAG
jgi:hypothetical protein